MVARPHRRIVAILAGGELLGHHRHVELGLTPPVTFVALENDPL